MQRFRISLRYRAVERSRVDRLTAAVTAGKPCFIEVVQRRRLVHHEHAHLAAADGVYNRFVTGILHELAYTRFFQHLDAGVAFLYRNQKTAQGLYVRNTADAVVVIHRNVDCDIRFGEIEPGIPLLIIKRGVDNVVLSVLHRFLRA